MSLPSRYKLIASILCFVSILTVYADEPVHENESIIKTSDMESGETTIEESSVAEKITEIIIDASTSNMSFTDLKASASNWNFYWVFPYHNDVSGKMIAGNVNNYIYLSSALAPCFCAIPSAGQTLHTPKAIWVLTKTKPLFSVF